MDNFENLRNCMEQLNANFLKSELGIKISKGLIFVEKLAYYFILNAFFVDMEWKPKIGTQFTTYSFLNQFKLDRNHKLLVNTLLHRLAKKQEVENDTILECIQIHEIKMSTMWIVINLPPSKQVIRQKLKELQTTLLEFPECVAEVELLTRVGHQLFAILRGRVNGIEILFPVQSVSSIFKYGGIPELCKNSMPMKYFKVSYMEEAVSQIITWEHAKQNLGIKILEICGGNGSVVAFPILKKLTSDSNASINISYTFTDISKFFVSKTKEKLENNFPTIDFEFKMLDIEKIPTEQGYKMGEYDIIIVADAFHTKRYLDDTIKHTRKLLKSNGLLILGEIFQSTLFLECTFGLTDGWWKFSDLYLRKTTPLINAEKWNEILKKYGFAKTFDVTNGQIGVVFGLAVTK